MIEIINAQIVSRAIGMGVVLIEGEKVVLENQKVK